MKKQILSLLLATNLVSVSIAGTIQNTNNEKRIKDFKQAEIKRSVLEFKESVFVLNQGQEFALEKLTANFLELDITSQDIEAYVLNTSSTKGYEKFKRVVDLGNKNVSLQTFSPEQTQLIISEALLATTEQGANWLGCENTNKVGMAVILAGVTVAILTVFNQRSLDRKNDRLNEQFAKNKERLTLAYLDEIEPATNAKNRAEAGLAANQAEAARIRNMLANDKLTGKEAAILRAKVKEIKNENAKYNSAIKRSNDFISETRSDYSTTLDRLTNQFDADNAKYDRRSRRNDNFLIMSGVTAGFGALSLVAGKKDC